MGALASTEQMATGRTGALVPSPQRPRRARSASRRRASWNVLAEELVPFPAPETSCVRAAQCPDGEKSSTHRRLGVHEAPGRTTQLSIAKPLTARTGDTMIHVGSRRASRPRGWGPHHPRAATHAGLAGLRGGTRARAQQHPPTLEIPAAAVKVRGGYMYLARPGDTLWSIASKLEPGGDPRILVAQLEQQLHGGELVAGDELKLP